jgi:hypothetical protein
MTDQLITSVVTVAVAIIGVAILAVLVSNNSNTVGVIKAGSAGFAQDLSVALGPVTNSGFTITNPFGSFA